VGGILVALALVAGCSSGGSDKASSGGYCDAVMGAREVVERVRSGDTSKATLDEFAAHVKTIDATAPTEVRQKYAAVWGGDEYAQDDLDVYNKKECGLEPLGVTPTSKP
jgi:hypothetical protein